MRWSAQLDRARTKLQNDGLASVAKRLPSFVLATGISGVVKRSKDRDAFLDSSNIQNNSHSDSIYEFGSLRRLELEKPTNQDTSPFSEEEQRFDPAYVCEFHDIYLLTSDGIKVTSTGQILGEEHYESMGDARLYTMIYRHVRDHGIRSVLPAVSVLLLNRQPMPKTTYEQVFPMVGFPMSFYHWVVEFLPRLGLLEQYTARTGNEPTILLPQNLSTYMIEYLDLLGYPEGHCERLGDTPALARSFVYPSHVRNRHSVPDPAACQWVRDRVLESVGPDCTGEFSSRILISRADARQRRLENENEILDRLRQFGFERVVLSNLDIAEQVELFSQVDCVVSTHGAGLVNVIYGDNVTLLELFGEDIQPHYYHLSNMFGHEYHCHVGTQMDGVDVYVKPDTIVSWVEKYLDTGSDSSEKPPSSG